MVTETENNKTPRFRIFIVSLFFCFFYTVIIFRAYMLQIHGNEKLSNLATSQHNANLRVSPQRGTIFDRKGEILAIDVPVASVGIHPHQIQDKDQVIKLLAEHTSLNLKQLAEKLASTKKFEWIERRIPIDNGRAIESPKLPGIQISQEYRRFYPNKELAGQLLGAVGYDAKALGGLELTYDQFLRSATTNKSVERDARGKFFSEPDQNLDTHHLYLTIDKNIQTFAETALKKTATKHQAKSGFALVLDVKTGEVLAMANYPGFNPNAYWKYPLDHWKNHAVIDVFEPGSTFKTILMAAALQNRTTKPTDRFFCENGQYQVGKNTINDHSPYGWLDAKTILQVSSNIGVTKIAQKLGRKKFYEFIKEIGFGKEVDVGVSGESAGAVRPYKSWRDIDFSNIAFGQGISVNGLQMTRAYGAIANGGHLFKPFLVKEIVDNSGHSVHKTEPINEKEVLDPTIAGELKQMLHLVTQTGGTSTQAHVPGYLSGGKTGTAQKFDTRLKAYAENQYISSFIGFTPLEDPRLAIFIAYDTPRKNGYYGGLVAGPVFKALAEETLKYMGEVSREQANTTTKIAQNKTDAKTNLAIVTPEQKWTSAQKDLSQNKVPNLKGLSLRQVLTLTQGTPVQLTVKGSGIVVKQMPESGDLTNTKEFVLTLGERT